MYLKIEHPDAITEDEKIMLNTAAAYDHTEVPVDEVLQLARQRLVCIWRVLTPDGVRGILTTQVLQFYSGKELYIWHMAGAKGFLNLHDEVVKVLSEYARQAGCQRIRALCRPALARKLAKDWNYGLVNMTRSV